MSTGLKANVDGSAAIQVGGVDAITLTSAGAASFVTSPMTIQGGSAAAPSLTFSGDTNTGIFSPAADTIAFSEGGVESMRIDSSGNVGIGTSSPSQALTVGTTSSGKNIAIYSSSNGNNGLLRMYDLGGTERLQLGVNSTGEVVYYAPTGSVHAWYVNTERARIDSSGNLLVGSTSSPATARTYLKGVSATSSDFALLVQNSAGTDMNYVRNDGLFSTGVASQSPYNKTTASAANVFVDSGGVLNRSTSSIKYKQNVKDAVHGLSDLLNLRAVTYEGKSEEDAGKTFGGLLAEEVHNAGLTEFVQYADDGSPDALAYGNMVSLCIKAIQELKAELDATKAEVALLKGAA